MAQHQPIRKRSSAGVAEIPDKLYFRIGEVARLCDVPAYVLRFWESEFPQLKPNKGGTGQRLYRRRDVETALRVKTLLYDEGYTIPGARQAIKSEMKRNAAQLALGMPEGSGADGKQLRALQKQLQELMAMLSKPAAARGALHAFGEPRTQRGAPQGAGTGLRTKVNAAAKSPKNLFESGAKPEKE
jgi:DNA-binding transcriptional MerR regulator